MATVRVTGILSYPYLHTPRAAKQGQTAKYSTSILIPKSDTKAYEDIQAAIAQARSEWKGAKLPKVIKSTLHDGADKADDDPRLADYWKLNATSLKKPVVVNGKTYASATEDDVFAGAEATVSLNAFIYNNDGVMGASFGLNGVLLTGNIGALGQLAGRPSVAAMFGDLIDLDKLHLDAAPTPSATADAPDAPEAAANEFSI